jgi:cytochrome d ubiquinol oxidase subunit II
LFGIALGNLVRGVNLGGVENGVSAYEAHYFFLPLWNASFSPTGTHPGVIDWFTIIIGVIAVIVLTIHGANWVILKTNSSINDKLKTVVFKLNIALGFLSLFSLSIWKLVHPAPFYNFLDKPYRLIFPLLFITGIISLFFVQKFKKDIYGLVSSSLIIIGGITSSLASMFPVILPSTNSVNPDLTIYNMAATSYGLSVGLSWVIIGGLLIIAYVIIQKRILDGKIDKMDYGH